MASKATTEVIIDGKVYTMSGYEGEEYLQKVAAYINGKIAECNEVEGFKRQSLDMRTMMIELNLADDYFKAKEKADQLQKELEQQKNQSYDVKHDLVSMQIQIEEAQKAVKELEAENKELLLSKTRLEASLEEVLFHGNHKDPKYEKVSREEVQKTVEARMQEKQKEKEQQENAPEEKNESVEETAATEQNDEK